MGDEKQPEPPADEKPEDQVEGSEPEPEPEPEPESEPKDAPDPQPPADSNSDEPEPSEAPEPEPEPNDNDDNDEPDEPDEPEDKPRSDPEPKAAKRDKSERASRWWWALPVIMVVEFFMYGYRGHIEVCVGKEGSTDFSLVGQERTDENRWKFPRCENRLNLGLRSYYDERAQEAVKVACRGATIFKHRGDGPKCVEATDGWEHRIETRQCPPWHSHYFEHLFWFLK